VTNLMDAESAARHDCNSPNQHNFNRMRKNVAIFNVAECMKNIIAQ
jgi:hypothetical protein